MIAYWLFIIIASLNATDAFATAYGLQLGVVDEQNPLALILWEAHPLLFLIIKCLMSFIVLYFAFFTNKSIWTKRFWTIALSAVTIMYVITNAVHLFWLSIHFQLITF